MFKVPCSYASLLFTAPVRTYKKERKKTKKTNSNSSYVFVGGVRLGVWGVVLVVCVCVGGVVPCRCIRLTCSIQPCPGACKQCTTAAPLQGINPLILMHTQQTISLHEPAQLGFEELILWGLF